MTSCTRSFQDCRVRTCADGSLCDSLQFDRRVTCRFRVIHPPRLSGVRKNVRPLLHILIDDSDNMHLRKWLGIELIEVSVTEKLIAATGGGLAIFCLFHLTSWALAVPDSSAIVTSMGASAVLLFAVPHGQLSQPWPAIVGQVVSALIGVTCAKLIPWPTVAAACAVGLSIGAMHQLKCIHPPGSATALAAVMGGDAIRRMGFTFVFCPVLVNSLLLVLLAVLFSLPFKRRRYPTSLNQPQVPPKGKPQPAHDDILKAIRSLDSFVDISEEDLVYLSTMLSSRNDADSKPQKKAILRVAKSR